MPKIKARLDITVDPPILVDYERCDLCGACVGICPPDCLIMDLRMLTVIGPTCIKCGFCIPACPVEALNWNEQPPVDGNGKVPLDE